MLRDKEKAGKNRSASTVTLPDLETELGALYQAPLADFTSTRNALSARLKKASDGETAARVKALPKPSVSAWAVNQLYWRGRDRFDRLIEATVEAMRAGEAAARDQALAARREAISDLLREAERLLGEAGHKPTPDTLRRVGTNLEALSVNSASGEPFAGRLGADLDPPGFEALAALMPGVGKARQAGRVVPFRSSTRSPSDPEGRDSTSSQKIEAARAELEEAQRTLRTLATVSERAEAERDKAAGRAERLESERREASERLEKATAALEAAVQRVGELEAEAREAAAKRKAAERGVEKARKKLERASAKRS